MSQLSSPSTVKSVIVTKISAVLVSLYTRDEIVDKSFEHFQKSTADEHYTQSDIDPSVPPIVFSLNLPINHRILIVLTGGRNLDQARS